MAERYEIAIKVISQKGTCVQEHKVGDEWLFARKTPAGMCPSAFHSLFPSARILMFGASLPWEDDPEATTIACPDAQNPVVFELRRLRP